MVPGFALDYQTGWHLSDPRQADEAEMLRRQTRPKFLLGSPPCSAFSQLLTFASATPERQDELVQEGMKHLRLSCKMYIEQMNEGNDFVHEHPYGSSSWSTDVVKEMLCRDDVYWVRMDMCSAGMKAKRRDGIEGPARKTSGWITSPVPEP